MNSISIRPTRVEIDLNAIAHNIQAVRSKVGDGVKIMAVVKADGYGHGATEVAKVALQSRADCLGVAIPEEGVELRLSGITAPILVLGLTPAEKVQEVIKYNLSQALSTTELAEALSAEAQKSGKVAKVHIKVDTGMSRIGVPPEEAVDFVKQILTLKAIEIEGIFTHFSVSDSVSNAEDKSFTELQIDKFKQVVARLEENGIQIPIKHAANSAGVLNFPSSYFDMVRPGIIIYGLYYSRGVAVAENLEPAMSFKTAIIYLKTVASEASISYGRTFTTKKESIIATLPVGYADGYNRLLSNKGEVLIKGRRAPIVGRVCMDMTMIDVSHIPEVKIGDEVVLFGKQGDAEIPMDEIADKTNTIVNEVACCIGKRVPRVYLR
jgi:alanine racemase